MVMSAHAREFVARHGRRGEDWIVAAEPRRERDLQALMAGTHVAVQLRRKNLGESSGVVPTLLGLGIPTIVSPVGAFKEYGNAVRFFDGDDPDGLADVILGMPATIEGTQTFVEAHGVTQFNSALLAVLEDMSPMLRGKPVSSVTQRVRTIGKLEDTAQSA
jgi:hypothetical protein